MSLDLRKLEKKRTVEKNGMDVIIARCPACASEGNDRKGEHLIVFPDGRFGCVLYPAGDPNSGDHRKLIWDLVGVPFRRALPVVRRYTPQVPLLSGQRITTVKPLDNDRDDGDSCDD